MKGTFRGIVPLGRAGPADNFVDETASRALDDGHPTAALRMPSCPCRSCLAKVSPDIAVQTITPLAPLSALWWDDGVVQIDSCQQCPSRCRIVIIADRTMLGSFQTGSKPFRERDVTGGAAHHTACITAGVQLCLFRSGRVSILPFAVDCALLITAEHGAYAERVTRLHTGEAPGTFGGT